MTRHALAARALAFALLLPATAVAAMDTGNIGGRVVDEASGKPVAGVTVTVSGPALAGEQVEFTDGDGHYIITELPPGEYLVRFYYSNIKIERPGVFVSVDQTLSVSVMMPVASAKTYTVVIQERAPTVDVANTQLQTQVTDELVRNVPVGSGNRTYSAILSLAPGAAVDPVGISFNGATGAENNFLLDGMNTTTPAFGLLGTNLSLEFIKETEIITAGYNAEYGRATGGVVNVITKSGSNEFHGGAWFFYNPFQLEPNRVARLGEAVASVRRLNDHAFDFGFDVGGPIVKDRVWFYAGFNPQFSSQSYDRIIRTRSADNLPGGQTSGQYLGDVYSPSDAAAQCPSWLADKSLCVGGAYKTTDTGAVQKFTSQARLYSGIAKLSIRLNDNNHLTLTYVASPSTFSGVMDNPHDPNSRALGADLFNGNPGSLPYTSNIQVHDVIGHFISKLLDRRLQLDVIGGFHYESRSTTPDDPAALSTSMTRDIRTFSLDQAEPGIGGGRCAQGTIHGVGFDPCPVSNYIGGGFGYLDDIVSRRGMVSAAATWFARLAGTHAIKLGIDFEDNQYDDHRYFSGGINGGRFIVGGGPDNSLGGVLREQFATLNPDGSIRVLSSNDPAASGLTARTETFNEALYLRDSYHVGFVPGLTINAGLRWEFQQVRGMARPDPPNLNLPGATTAIHTEMNIWDNIAPRVGLVYDFTQKGRSKLFASYGRYYESVPLDINDRQFSGEGFVIQQASAADCGISPAQNKPGVQVDTSKCSFPAPTRANSALSGGNFGVVSPNIKGQYSNEYVVGLQYDVGWDLVLGASYIRRELGRVIEDISPDGGANFIIANPGEPTDPGVVSQLQKQINDYATQMKATSDPNQLAVLQARRSYAQTTLALYQGAASFEKPRRDYNALVLTATKRLSHNFIVLASYTYGRTIGNYPGLFQASTNTLDPNISTQYDLRELLANRNGPLPEDRPHLLKLAGAYFIPTGASGGFTLGLNFQVQSGTPIDVLGRNPYGPDETFILPRGSGGRTPTLTQLDLHVSYARNFGGGKTPIRAELIWDAFNVFNQQTVTRVDNEYSLDNVLPISGGSVADLANLKTTTGAQPRLNPNYGQPTQYQAPLSMRFGARISF